MPRKRKGDKLFCCHPKRKKDKGYKEYLEPGSSGNIPRTTLLRYVVSNQDETPSGDGAASLSSASPSGPSHNEEQDFQDEAPYDDDGVAHLSNASPSHNEQEALFDFQDEAPSDDDGAAPLSNASPSHNEQEALFDFQDEAPYDDDGVAPLSNASPSHNEQEALFDFQDEAPSDDDGAAPLSNASLSDDSSAFSSDCSLSNDDSASLSTDNSDVPMDDPFGRIGTDSDMDSKLTSTGTTTKAEALLMIMSHAARHNITGSQLDDLLKLINQLFGKNVVPGSKHAFNKVFKNNNECVEFQFYCKGCKANMGTEQDMQENNITQCAECNIAVDISTMNSASFFINVPIAPQIQCLLENPEIHNTLSYRFDRPHNGENVISDIYDGDLYKELSAADQILSNSNNLSYIFNSDGSPLFKSSKFSIWPIQLHLNELPPKIRFKHVILAGLWFGSNEPAMHVFLKPFVDQAKSLVSKGVSWRKNETQVNSKVVGLCCCVDSKARPTMQNTTQFNGYFGCGFCLHPGNLVERQVKYTVTATEYADRDAEGMLGDMELAMVEQKRVRGVKGPSPLINMPYFDIVWGFVPDYMHAVLLGVARQLTELLLEGTDQPYYVGCPATLRVLENRIKSIQPPHLITRLPRPLSERKFWKASEWRAWLLFYSLPCLEGLLDARYIKHLSLLASAVFLLLKEEVSFDEVNKADVMLLEFVVRFQLLYGENAMTFNVHLLTHLAKSVKLWGPLWAHSAFVFENANGSLLKLVHGTKCVPLQIVQKFLLHRAMPHFSAKYAVSERVLQFCSEMNEYSKVQKYKRQEDTTVLDSGRVKCVTQEERDAFLSAQIEVPDEILTHRRMIHNGLVFTGKYYSRSKRRSESCARLTDGRIGEIHHIISYTSEGRTEIALLFKPFDTQHASFPLPRGYGFVPHITHVTEGDPSLIHLIPVHKLGQKCIVVKSADRMHVCDFPNQYERD